ncbi:GtrA family protein [Amnibacterium kyonggiense]|uniref:Putative flippase GtrA n=1 Tax=Amnibacterium kyonggiense TaxID=595671 RepID=A0A4R7FRG9_9MICO|nr:GtrA family protein [Amnibacterium kyonggiense]TDS80425.1 putative flippase GtrA [Amnibacterium kyonggiense]
MSARVPPVLIRLVRFAAVGGVGFLVDLGAFTLLRLGPLSPEHVAEGPLVAKAISTLCAIAVNWAGNRWWAFRLHRRDDVVREGMAFLVTSLLGSSVALLCLWTSHDLLGLRSAIDDTVSANVVGLVLGSAVRFWLASVWVFPVRRVPTAVVQRDG